MILDFDSFIRRGLLADLERPVELWAGQIADRAGGGGEWRDQRGDGKRQKDHRPESEKPIDSASSWEIPMIRNAFVSTA